MTQHSMRIKNRIKFIFLLYLFIYLFMGGGGGEEASVSSDRSTIKQQLNGLKNKQINVGYLSACDCGVFVSST